MFLVSNEIMAWLRGYLARDMAPGRSSWAELRSVPHHPIYKQQGGSCVNYDRRWG